MVNEPRSRGRFITLEGADGAGKTTQLSFIEKWLVSKNIDLAVTREPGGTVFGEALRALLLDKAQLEISDEAELLTVFAARQQHIQERILPSLEKGRWVLSDRFTDASYAYQGGGRGIDASRIAELENWVQAGLQPDLTILLDIDVDLGRERSSDRGNKPDRFERQSIEFKAAVRKCYLDRAAQHPGRIKTVDASESIQSVQQQIDVILKEFTDHLWSISQ
ncbi:MAG: dTMP kinase [Acidiferrobacterales bacterium]|nr:dTMP kinase [Acidiferrobacterales bacterium]